MSNLKSAIRKALLLVTARRAYQFRLRPELLELFRSDVAHVVGNLGLYYPLEPAPVPDLGKGPIMVVGAHPDDEAVGAGGSLIKAAAQGRRIEIAFLTSGQPSTEDPEAIAEVRTGEAKKAATALSAGLQFFGAPVRNLSRDRDYTEKAVTWLAALMTDIKPQAVLCPFPLDAHSDHRITSWATAHAIEKSGQKPIVWAYEIASLCPANVIIDITDQETAKAKLIGLYKSQTDQFDYVNTTLGLNRYHSRHLGGRGSAEAFYRVPAHEFGKILARLSKDQVFK